MNNDSRGSFRDFHTEATRETDIATWLDEGLLMTEHIPEELLDRYLNGTPLTEEQDSHLLECAECTALLGRLLDMKPYNDRAEED